MHGYFEVKLVDKEASMVDMANSMYKLTKVEASHNRGDQPSHDNLLKISPSLLQHIEQVGVAHYGVDDLPY